MCVCLLSLSFSVPAYCPACQPVPFSPWEPFSFNACCSTVLPVKMAGCLWGNVWVVNDEEGQQEEKMPQRDSRSNKVPSSPASTPTTMPPNVAKCQCSHLEYEQGVKQNKYAQEAVQINVCPNAFSFFFFFSAQTFVLCLVQCMKSCLMVAAMPGGNASCSPRDRGDKGGWNIQALPEKRKKVME